MLDTLPALATVVDSSWPGIMVIVGPGSVAAIATVATVWIRRRRRGPRDRPPPKVDGNGRA